VRLRAAAKTREATLSFARLRGGPKARLDATSPFGACTHFAQGKGRLSVNLELLSRMGARWLRDEASWGAIEREKGRYTFPPAFDAYIQAAPRYGIEPYLIFDYGNSLYDGGRSPASREAISAFAEYAYQLVQRYKGSCRFWEVYNEPNIGFWSPKPNAKDYAVLLRAASMAAKRADPHCTVIGMCTAGTDLAFIEEVLKQNVMDAVDGISIHPYRYPKAPEESDFVGELTRCKALLDRYGGKEKSLWLTEVGWPTQNDARGVSEEASANYLARMYVQAMSLPFVRTTFWYDFQNDGTNPTYNEDNFGLIRSDFTPKAGYVAYRMMTEALAGKRFVRRLPLPEPLYAYEFAAGGERAIAAWCARGSGGALLRLNAPAVDVSDVHCRYSRLATRDGILSLALSEAPVFLTGRFASPEVLPSPLAAEAPVPELENYEAWSSGSAPLLPGETAKLAVTVRNPWRQPLSPSVRVEAPQGWSVAAAGSAEPIPPGGEAKLLFTLKVPPTAECRDYSLRLALLDGQGTECAAGAAVVSVANPFEVSLRPFLIDERYGLEWRVESKVARPLPHFEASLSFPKEAKTATYGTKMPFNAPQGQYICSLPLGAVPLTRIAGRPKHARVIAWSAICRRLPARRASTRRSRQRHGTPDGTTRGRARRHR
jgi:hypothetical protein